MTISEPQFSANEVDRENVIQAFKDWRAKKLSIPEERAYRARPSVMRRILRTLAFGVIAVFIALAVAVWQSGSREMEKAASALQAWLTRFTTHASAIPIGATKAPTENTAVAQRAPPDFARRPTEEEYNALKQQVETVANELTGIRRIAEQLAVNQKQMGEDIAALKASEESINQKLLSASPHSATASAAPKKKLTEHPKMGVAGRSSSEHSSVGAPLPLR